MQDCSIFIGNALQILQSCTKPSISWWRHQMETFSALLAICAGNSPVPDEFPAQRPVTRSFDVFSLIWVWMNGWVNNGEAGDLRRYRAHYNVIVMWYMTITKQNNPRAVHRSLDMYCKRRGALQHRKVIDGIWDEGLDSLKYKNNQNCTDALSHN